MMAERAIPKPTPETQHYWEGAKQGELRLQRCDACQHTYFPPRPFCPDCGARAVSVSGVMADQPMKQNTPASAR